MDETNDTKLNETLDAGTEPRGDTGPQGEPGATFRTLSGELRVLKKQNKYLYDVELDLLDDRVCANNWQFINLEEHRPMFAWIPITIAYAHGGRKIGDGHNHRMVRDEDGTERPSFTDADSERIIGSLSADEKDITLTERDGNKWIVGKGTIWTWYAAEAVEKIARQGRMSVSIWASVTKEHMEGDVYVEEKYVPISVTILGDDVAPAVKGANIRPLAGLGAEQINELKLRAASYIGKPDDAEQPANEPKKKGVKTKVSIKKMREMQALFPNDRVLSISDDGMNVMLCSKKDGDVRGYAFSPDAPDAVLENRYVEAAANVEMVFASSGYEASIPLDDVLRPLQEQISTLNDQLAEEKKLREQADADLKAMREQEIKRRKSCAKEAVRKTFDEINAIRSAAEKIDDKECKEIEAAIDKGEYEECTNEKGEWDGDERACAALKAKCMDIVLKLSSEAAAKNKAVYAWDGGILRNEGVADPAVDAINKWK